MNNIVISVSASGVHNNASLAVMKALESAPEKKDITLSFEKGEYHFYEEGMGDFSAAVRVFAKPIKKVAFPIIGYQNFTIDGGGSVFVFHNQVFPFIVHNSENVKITNFIMDRPFPVNVEFHVCNITDDGFLLKTDKSQLQFSIVEKSIIFHMEGHDISLLEDRLSLHDEADTCVRYILAGNTRTRSTNLPAPHFLVDAEDHPEGISFRYREGTPYKCDFNEGQLLRAIIDNTNRYLHLFGMERSKNILIKDVTVRRGLGMGIVGLLCTNIEIDHFSTDISYHNDSTSMSADALHFVNCDGKMHIHNCSISNTMDDVINTHGNYLVLERAEQTSLILSVPNHYYYHFIPYDQGDTIRFIETENYNVVAHFVVDETTVCSEKGDMLKVTGHFIDGFENVSAENLVENYLRMPNLHLHHNHFRRFPHMRISGGGDMLIEDNLLENCSNALLAYDLAAYWYESGRINNLVFRNNTIDGSNSFCIDINVRTLNKKRPLLHERIEVTGNKAKNLPRGFISTKGIKKLIFENNQVED